MTRMRGTALVEFALAWPVALLLVLGCVELSVWGVESYAAQSAALAGARAASASDAGTGIGEQVTLRSLAPSLAGTAAAAWCPGAQPAPAGVWVCATDRGQSVEVAVGGLVPALVPLLGARGLPIHADASMERERFTS